MSVITACAARAGRVTIMKSDAPAPVAVSFDFPVRKDFPTYISYVPNPQPISTLGIAIGIRTSQEVAAQFQNTLDASIYVTPFGDRPGVIEIDFLANRSCSETDESLDVIEQYLRMRLLPTDLNYGLLAQFTPRQTVTVGRSAFVGYITKLTYTASTAQGVDIRATLSMQAWPL